MLVLSVFMTQCEFAQSDVSADSDFLYSGRVSSKPIHTAVLLAFFSLVSHTVVFLLIEVMVAIY